MQTNILRTWAKSPHLKGADILILSDCLTYLYPQKIKELAEKHQVMTVCPEGELGAVVYGKLASMLRSLEPRSLVVVTTECSPHCYTLQAAVNEALYIVGFEIPTQRYTCLNGTLIPISAEAVRLSRYLHLVEAAIKENPGLIEKLEKHSLEQQACQVPSCS